MEKKTTNEKCFPNCREDGLQSYDWLQKPFWSTCKKVNLTYKNIRKITTSQTDD